MSRPKMSKAMQQYFRDQGSIGGKKATDAMTPERRQEIARKAAQARWAKKGKA